MMFVGASSHYEYARDTHDMKWIVIKDFELQNSFSQNLMQLKSLLQS
jgi:hypothetical protein